jgi:hypothetical protein
MDRKSTTAVLSLRLLTSLAFSKPQSRILVPVRPILQKVNGRASKENLCLMQRNVPIRSVAVFHRVEKNSVALTVRD